MADMADEPEESQKDCPSCGSLIAEAATRCDFCKSKIGKCEGCGAWIVEGTQCLDCGKSTARRVKKPGAPAAAAAEPEEAAVITFHGSGFGLFLPFMLRQILVLAWVASIVYATAAIPTEHVAPIKKFLGEHGVPSPSEQTKWWALWIFSGVLLLAVMVSSRLVRRYRAQHTHFLGQPLEYQPSMAAAIGNSILSVIVLGLTAGLGVPWLYARQVRSFHRSCKVTGRGGRTLEWDGSGEAVLGRFLVMLLLLPIAIATAGFGGIVISWMWISWEQKHLKTPDRNGLLQRVRFTGTFAGFFLRAAVGWLLTLVTAGLYWPWAKVGDWEWIANHTEAA
jgi:hypothetical protein